MAFHVFSRFLLFLALKLLRALFPSKVPPVVRFWSPKGPWRVPKGVPRGVLGDPEGLLGACFDTLEPASGAPGAA